MHDQDQAPLSSTPNSLAFSESLGLALVSDRHPKIKPKSEGQNGTEKSQSERFIEAARAIGVDETRKEFERAFKQIVTSPKRRA